MKNPLNRRKLDVYSNLSGDVAQLGEHQVRNLGVESSILFVSTNLTHKAMQFSAWFRNKKKGLSHEVIFHFGGSPIFLLQSLLEMLFRIYILKKGTQKNLSLC